MSILHMAVVAPTPPHRFLSFSLTLTSANSYFFLPFKPSSLSLQITHKVGPIRMGGGPRTFPGGVSKWQWKRMQAKKAKQLLKARLARERQIYEMRKRAELKAAVSDLELPWEAVEKAPKLFSVNADEQLKVLADRFQRPGGFDLWSESDGPELFKTVDDLPSARFFPKGVVHSVKPYGRISDGELESQSEEDGEGELGNGRKEGYRNQRSRGNSSRKIGENVNSSIPKKRNQKKVGKASDLGSLSGNVESARVGFDRKQRGAIANGVRNVGSRRMHGSRDSKSEVYDMNLLEDGSFGL